jgi:teichuronic acid biosynthesis glycosyltransferase TuaC
LGTNGARLRRIALITPIFPFSGDPTRGRFIYETAKGLAAIANLRIFFQQAVYPQVPGLTPRSQIYATTDRDYEIDGLSVSPVSYPAIPGISRAINGWVSGRRLLPHLRRFAPELVLAYWVYPDGFAALQAARKIGVPCVVGALGTDIHIRSGLSRWLSRRTISKVDALLTVSEDMRRVAITDFDARPEKVHSVINGINTSVFFPASRDAARFALGLRADAELIVYVGRLVATKGLGELVEAAALLARKRPRLRLALIGNGLMRDQLSALIAAAGLTDRVLLTGGLSPAEVAQWINASNMLTLPSWSEGYPNVLVEAIACGRPVVATDVGGTREIVNASNGMLIPPRQVSALATALETCLESEWDHMAIAAAMRRSWADVAADTLAVCEQVLASSGRA